MRIILVCITAWFVAQVIKVILNTIKLVYDKIKGNEVKKVTIGTLFKLGGMPSSHTATVISLSTCIGALEGFNSTMFAVAGVFAFITMFDAFMVRLPVEKLTEAFNVVREAVLGKDIKALRKVEGHTIPEIIGGVITGATVALLYLEYSPLFPEYVSLFQQF
jgi:acid phosphatase family membrane protein YuiD